MIGTSICLFKRAALAYFKSLVEFVDGSEPIIAYFYCFNWFLASAYLFQLIAYSHIAYLDFLYPYLCFCDHLLLHLFQYAHFSLKST